MVAERRHTHFSDFLKGLIHRKGPARFPTMCMGILKQLSSLASRHNNVCRSLVFLEGRYFPPHLFPGPFVVRFSAKRNGEVSYKNHTRFFGLVTTHGHDFFLFWYS